MEKHKVIGTIIGVLAFIALIVGVTYAWYTWQNSNNTNVTFTVSGADITFDAGSDVTSSRLRPVSTKEIGVEKGYAIEKIITASSPVTVYLNLYLTIENLPDELKNESFKWEVYNNNNLVSIGNFKYNSLGDKITIASNQKITSTVSTYKLYIWIDGNMSNPSTMQNQTFKFLLSADATDEEPLPSFITLTKLGLKVSEGSPDFNKTAQASCSDETTCETTNGIYEAEDDLGISYYFRGAVENNYVKFAGFYWRIIRINGDGTIRMIYDGTSAHANGESSTDRQVSTTPVNANYYNDNAYVGYMYGTPGSSTYEDTHANINDSTIKTANDNWYKTNIIDNGYSQYIADAIYCNDRSLSEGTGIGTTVTSYMAFNRLYTNKTPTLKCAQNEDKFTTSSSLGNGDLTYPVGLITADEVGLAGGSDSVSDNKKFYFWTGQGYWTMSPYHYEYSFELESSRNYIVNLSGRLSPYTTSSNLIYLKPVISLKSDIIFIGNGTISSPFEIVS